MSSTRFLLFFLLTVSCSVFADQPPWPLPEALYKQVMSENFTSEPIAEIKREYPSIPQQKDFRYKITDLNGDGVADFFVEVDHAATCGSGGCMFWIYQGEKDGGYKKIYDGFGGADADLDVTSRVVNGYRLIVFLRGTAGFSTYAVAYFNGEKYVDFHDDEPPPIPCKK